MSDHEGVQYGDVEEEAKGNWEQKVDAARDLADRLADRGDEVRRRR